MKEKSYSYARSWRAVEILSLVAFVLAQATVLRHLLGKAQGQEWTLLCALVAGWLASDLTSGTVHWLFDTFGSVNTPILGPTVIRTFREHHGDPLSITKHDFIELNGSNALVALPLVIWAAISASMPYALQAFISSLCWWTLATNIIHQMAHREDPPALGRWAQKLGLILSPEVHQVHHSAPFDRYYCITNGHMNPLLDKLGVFDRAERLVRALSRNTGLARDK